MVQRRYYNLEKLAAPPKVKNIRDLFKKETWVDPTPGDADTSGTPESRRAEFYALQAEDERRRNDPVQQKRTEEALKKSKQEQAQTQQEWELGIGTHKRRELLNDIATRTIRNNERLSQDPDAAADYRNAFVEGFMTPENIKATPLDKIEAMRQDGIKQYGEVEHPYLDGDWSAKNTSRMGQLFGASRMNDKGQMEEVPLGYDMYGKPIESKMEQAAQYALRPLDTTTKVITEGLKLPGKAYNWAKGKAEDMELSSAEGLDRENYARLIREGKIQKPANYDYKTSYKNDPEFYANSNTIKTLKNRSDEFDEEQQDIKAHGMAKRRREADEHWSTDQEASDFFDPQKNKNLSFYQKKVVPLVERGESNVEKSYKAIGLDKLDKLEKEYPWVGKIRGLAAPAAKTFIAVAAAANPQLSGPLTEILSLFEAGEAGLGAIQATGKGAINYGKEVDKVNKGPNEAGEYEGKPGQAAGGGLVDALSKIPFVANKDGKVDLTNIDKLLTSAQVQGKDNILGQISNLTKDTVKWVGGKAEQLAEDEVSKKMLNEGAKGLVNTGLAATGNPLSPATKPLGTTSKALKVTPNTNQGTQNSKQKYLAELSRIDTMRANNYPVTPNSPLQPEYQQGVDYQTDTQQQQQQPIFDVSNIYQPQQPTYNASNNFQQRQSPTGNAQPQAVNPQPRPVQQQAINPKPQQQAVNPQQPTQPQTAQVKVTKPNQGTQVASVTPATKGYKVQ